MSEANVAPDWIDAVARDWIGYGSRFGIAEEVNQGAITEAELLVMANGVRSLRRPRP
jgi:hypothetical protein